MENEKKEFTQRLKRDNKELAIRVENLELQIKYYAYSQELEGILKNLEAANGADTSIPEPAQADVKEPAQTDA
jgi:predicted ribosome quality control (RQC) complex YloA/Tae2 family protein